MSERLNRRRFVAAAAAAGVGVGIAVPSLATAASAEGKPAILGGKRIRTKGFPSWPRTEELDEKSVGDVVRGHRWCRLGGKQVNQFEETYKRLTGAKHCVATANGTSALVASLGALQIGPGQEVIVSPYTFIATINAILMHYALPIFVDTDPETFLIDASKIEAAITDRTAAILPVHIGGSSVDLDTIMAIGKKHKLPVIEDACQAHLGEWRNRKVGTYGITGCFSFQESKNLSAGEGGAILTNDEDLATRLFAFHNNCRAPKMHSYDFAYTGTRAANFRMTEFQGALLLAQLTRFESVAKTREANATYLTTLLEQIPGILPAKMYPGCTRNSYHLYMLRYQPEKFAGLPRDGFLKALGAEGIGAFGGYSPMSSEKFLSEVLNSPGFARIYPKEVIAKWPERNQCPANYKLCSETVWFGQNMFLGTRQDMDEVAAAIRRIQAHAAEIAKKV